MSNETCLRIVTYNIGGGRDEFPASAPAILAVIQQLAPDILGLQECTEWIDANHRLYSFREQVDQVLGFKQPGFLGKTISLREHFHATKSIMVASVYRDWQDWLFGNALCSRFPFSRLSDSSISGSPYNLPLYKPSLYEGNRDTDPRWAILARVNCGQFSPFVVNTHLTTLVGERGNGSNVIPGKLDQAQAMRLEQTRKLLALLKPKIDEHETIILMGDFNAWYGEQCIASVLLDSGFLRLLPGQEKPTHPKVSTPVDHIFIYPAESVIQYNCWVDDSPAARAASDHLPVAADIVIKGN